MKLLFPIPQEKDIKSVKFTINLNRNRLSMEFLNADNETVHVINELDYFPAQLSDCNEYSFQAEMHEIRHQETGEIVCADDMQNLISENAY